MTLDAVESVESIELAERSDGGGVPGLKVRMFREGCVVRHNQIDHLVVASGGNK